MAWITRATFALFGIVIAGPVSATDVAELFPADTLAYAELRRPAEIADALTAVFAGGADPVASTHDRSDRATSPHELPGIHRVGLLRLLTTPELLAETKRLGGAGVGVVGFSERGEPRVAAAVLLGDSHAAGLAVRAFLAASPNLRRVADADGVPVFQHRGFTGPVMGNDGQPLPKDGEQKGRPVGRPTAGTDEWTYAHASGLFVVGTDVPAVTDVLRRFAGKAPGAALAAAGPFTRHREVRDRGGAFLYAAPPMVVTRLDQASRPSEGRDAGSSLVAWLRFAVGTKSVRSVAGTLHVRPEAVALTAEADVDDSVPSAALGLLTGPPVAADLPPGTGRSLWAVTVSMPPADRRAGAILAVLDARARALGSLGRPPSEAVAEADRGDNSRIAADLLAGVRAVTLFAPAGPELPSGASPVPTLVLHTDSDATAEAWETAAPRLFAIAVGSPPAVSTEVSGGVRVRTFTADGLPGNAPLHLARVGSAVAVGQDRKRVAEAAQAKTAEAAGTSACVFQVAPWALADAIHTPPEKPKVEPSPRVVRRAFAPPPVIAPDPPAAGLAAVLRPLPVVTGTVVRDGAGVRVEARLPDAKAALPAAWAGFLAWVERQPVGPVRRPGFAYPE